MPTLPYFPRRLMAPIVPQTLTGRPTPTAKEIRA